MKRYILVILAAWFSAIMPFIIFGQDTNGAAAQPPEVTAEATPYLSQLLKLNQVLLGLPAIPLIVVGCIIFGYFIKLLPIVTNRWIPTWVFAFGIVANLVITPPTSLELLGRASIYGLVCAGVSIFIHRRWLKDWIDIDVFKDIGKEQK